MYTGIIYKQNPFYNIKITKCTTQGGILLPCRRLCRRHSTQTREPQDKRPTIHHPITHVSRIATAPDDRARCCCCRLPPPFQQPLPTHHALPEAFFTPKRTNSSSVYSSSVHSKHSLAMHVHCGALFVVI